MCLRVQAQGQDCCLFAPWSDEISRLVGNPFYLDPDLFMGMGVLAN